MKKLIFLFLIVIVCIKSFSQTKLEINYFPYILVLPDEFVFLEKNISYKGDKGFLFLILEVLDSNIVISDYNIEMFVLIDTVNNEKHKINKRDKMFEKFLENNNKTVISNYIAEIKFIKPKDFNYTNIKDLYTFTLMLPFKLLYPAPASVPQDTCGNNSEIKSEQ